MIAATLAEAFARTTKAFLACRDSDVAAPNAKFLMAVSNTAGHWGPRHSRRQDRALAAAGDR